MKTAVRLWVPVSLTVLGAVTCPALAAAADVAVDLHVDRVTVYQQGAVVTRAGSVSLPAGTNRLIIGGLPAAIPAKSLHVAVTGGESHLGGIEVEQIHEANFVSEAERELRRRLDQKTDQRAALQDDVATAGLQLKLLDSLAASPAGGASKAAVDGASLGTVLATMGTNAAAAHRRIRDSNLQLRDVDREIERLKSDLAKVATRSKTSTEVRAAVDSATPAAAIVTVSYPVSDAGWHWIYEARLDTVQNRLALQRQGEVQQGSGEDWKNVELTLTTALPSDDVATPVVGSVFLNLEEPVSRTDRADQLRSANPRAMTAPAAAPALQEVVLSAKRNSARVLATDYLADYRIAARVSLLADREPRLYPISEDAFDVSLLARVVPAAGLAAHLEAVFTYQRELPLESGQLQLYRDGAYVGEAQTQAFLPGAAVRMPFGADERLRVTVHDEPAQSAERGVISRQVIKETRRRFEVTNYHPRPIAVEIIDRIPVSQHADVRVEVLKGATEPSVKDVDGTAGVFLWRVEALPQKTAVVRHYYSVQYPLDRQLIQAE
jgi:uncharacterized protein (TIGR02231 family)